jgi:RimJ/RimL family protein N-acetyltransferase
MSEERGHPSLRSWRPDEARHLVAICDEAEVAFRTPFPSPFLESLAQTFIDGRDGYLDLAITDETDVPVGLATLNLRTRSASYVVGSSARGRGHATRALAALCQLAHADLGLDWMVLEIEPGNRPSEVVAERCGFRRLDSEPEHVEDKGRAYSLATWELTLGG